MGRFWLPVFTLLTTCTVDREPSINVDMVNVSREGVTKQNSPGEECEPVIVFESLDLSGASLVPSA